MRRRLQEPAQELSLGVYQTAEGVDASGEPENYSRGVVVCNGHYFVEFSGDARTIARNLADTLASDYRGRARDSLVLNFPTQRTAISFHVDGFWGRPLYFGGAMFLKPLSNRRRNALAREFSKIKQITDRKGRKIPFRVNLGDN